MIKASFKPGQIKELHKDLDAMRPKKLLKRRLDPLAKEVIEHAGAYPPPVSGSQRTGHLRREWFYELHGLDAEIGNLASYAGYVHGDEQTSVHKRHGWKQIMDVAVDEVDNLIKKLMTKIGRMW